MQNCVKIEDSTILTRLGIIFNTALELVKEYVAEGKLDCSTDVTFAGLTDAEDLAVRLSRRGQRFNIAFSKHFVDNRDEKIEKTFVRYIATTNIDGSFKPYEQVRACLHRLPFERHYDVTYQNDYLLSDDKSKLSGVICDKCGRAFRYKPGAPEFTKTNRLLCCCGGSLVTIINGVKRFTSNTIERYVSSNFTKNDQTTIDLNDFNRFGVDVRETVGQLLGGVTRPTARQLQPIVASLVASRDKQIILAFDDVYKLVCEAIYRQLSPEDQAYVVATIGRQIPPEPVKCELSDQPRRGAASRKTPTIELPEITRDEELDKIFFANILLVPNKLKRPQSKRGSSRSTVITDVSQHHEVVQPEVVQPEVVQPEVVQPEVVQPVVDHKPIAEVKHTLTDAELVDAFFNCVPADLRQTKPAFTDAELNVIFFVADQPLCAERPLTNHGASSVGIEVIHVTDEQLTTIFFD